MLELRETYKESEKYKYKMVEDHKLEVHRNNLLVDELTKQDKELEETRGKISSTVSAMSRTGSSPDDSFRSIAAVSVQNRES